MIRHVCTYELIHLTRSGKFWLITGVLPVLIAFSLYLGYQRVNAQHETIASLIESERLFYEDMAHRQHQIEQGEYEVGAWFQDPGNPLALAQFNDAGRHVVLAPLPLAALSTGQSDLFPYYGKVTLTGRTALRDNALENPVMQATGVFDFAFVLVWLIPLFVIAMGYDVRSREKESGTYALLQSQPVSVSRLLVVKMLFRFVILNAIVLLSWSLFALLMQIPVFSSGGLHVMIYLLAYTGFWFAWCIGVNLISDRSAINAIALIGLWVLFVLIIPALITLYAGHNYPIPSRAMWVTEQRAIEQGINAERDALFESWKADHPEEVLRGDTPGFYQVWMQRLVTNEQIQNQMEVAQERFVLARTKQADAIARLRPLSPSMALHHRMHVLAGTDAERLQQLEDAMRAFQKEWQEFFIPRFRQLDFFTSDEILTIPRPS